MGPQGPIKGNSILTRSLRSIRSITVCFKKFVFFYKKRHHTAKLVCFWVPRDPITIYLVTTFSKNARKLRFHVFLLFHANIEDIFNHHIEVDRIHKKLRILSELWVPEDTKINWNIFKISCEFGTLHAK